MPGQAYFLMAFANPPEAGLPALAAEAAGLEKTLSTQHHLSGIVLPKVSFEQLADTFAQYRNQIYLLHYAGHAGDQELHLLKASGESVEKIHAPSVAHLLAQYYNLQLVFLNGCATAGQVEALLDAGIRMVIATQTAIDDQAARDFSLHFYSNLLKGQSIEKAFRLASAMREKSGTAPATVVIRAVRKTAPEPAPMWSLFVRETARESLDWTLEDLLFPDVFRPEVARLVDHFTGRSAELEQIQSFINSKEKGRLLVSGPPGIGKSALLAFAYQKAYQAEKAGLLQRKYYILYLFRNGNADMGTFIDYLAEKLDRVCPTVPLQGQSLPERHRHLARKIQEVSEALQVKQQQVILFLDGLDEVSQEQLGYLFLPIPPAFRLIAGARPGDQLDRLEQGWASVDTRLGERLELGPIHFSQATFRETLAGFAGLPPEQLSEHLVAAAFAQSKGHPQYLRLLSVAMRLGAVPPEDPDGLQNFGVLDDLYRAIVRRFQSPSIFKAWQCLLAFATAKEPLSPALVNWYFQLPLSEGSPLEAIREVLTAGGAGKYQFFHETFREYLLREHPDACREANYQWVKIGSDWQSLNRHPQAQSYAARHLPEHLASAGNQDTAARRQLVTLMQDEAYIEFQVAITGQYTASFYGWQAALNASGTDKAALGAVLSRIAAFHRKQGGTAWPEVRRWGASGNIEGIQSALERLRYYEGQEELLGYLALLQGLLLESEAPVSAQKSLALSVLEDLDKNVSRDLSVLDWRLWLPAGYVQLLEHKLKDLGLTADIIYQHNTAPQKTPAFPPWEQPMRAAVLSGQLDHPTPEQSPQIQSAVLRMQEWDQEEQMSSYRREERGAVIKGLLRTALRSLWDNTATRWFWLIPFLISAFAGAWWIRTGQWSTLMNSTGPGALPILFVVLFLFFYSLFYVFAFLRRWNHSLRLAREWWLSIRSLPWQKRDIYLEDARILAANGRLRDAFRLTALLFPERDVSRADWEAHLLACSPESSAIAQTYLAVIAAGLQRSGEQQLTGVVEQIQQLHRSTDALEAAEQRRQRRLRWWNAVWLALMAVVLVAVIWWGRNLWQQFSHQGWSDGLEIQVLLAFLLWFLVWAVGISRLVRMAPGWVKRFPGLVYLISVLDDLVLLARYFYSKGDSLSALRVLNRAQKKDFAMNRSEIGRSGKAWKAIDHLWAYGWERILGEVTAMIKMEKGLSPVETIRIIATQIKHSANLGKAAKTLEALRRLQTDEKLTAAIVSQTPDQVWAGSARLQVKAGAILAALSDLEQISSNGYLQKILEDLIFSFPASAAQEVLEFIGRSPRPAEWRLAMLSLYLQALATWGRDRPAWLEENVRRVLSQEGALSYPSIVEQARELLE